MNWPSWILHSQTFFFGCLALTEAAAKEDSVAMQPKKNVYEWRIQDGQFTCGKTGSLARPLLKFFQEWLDTCCEHYGRKLLPKVHMVKEMVTNQCFLKGCE